MPPTADAQTLSVIQHTPGVLTVGEHTIDATCAGGTYTIEFSSNKEMELTVPTWCSIEESRAVESHSVRIRVKENLSKEKRTGEIIITGVEDKSLCEVITVNQEALIYTIKSTLEEGQFKDARSHEFSISAESPISFETEVSEPIIKVSEGLFRIPANHTPGTAGSASIFLKCNGTVVECFPVYYSAPKTPEITLPEIKVPANAERASIGITTNTDIEFEITYGSDWCKIDEIETHLGNTTDTWTFALTENTLSTDRSATIRFSAGRFWNGTATIVQAGKKPENGSTVTVDIPAGGSLSEALGDNLLNIGNLTVSGEINGADVVAIRQMVTDGKLYKLDLSKAEIKKDLLTSYTVDGANPYKPTKTTEDNMIGHWLFLRSHLREIIVPENLQHIGYKAFAESDLESVVLPEGLLTMEESAFYRCESLRSATVPSTLAEIPDCAFELCPLLEEVNLSEGLRSIGEMAFAPYGAYTTDSRLRKISIPSTVESLGRRCLMTTKISEATVPASVKKMGDGIFMECRDLVSVRFLCEADTLPDRILYNVLNLQKIEFPKGLKVIGANALDHAGLADLVIPEGVTTLMEGALIGSGYNSLILPESLEEIKAFALGYQSRVSSFTIPRNVKKIGNRAFDGACYFKELHMNPTVPPEHEGEIFFRTFDYSECTLYVPAGSKSAYESDSYWLKFKEIIEE